MTWAYESLEPKNLLASLTGAEDMQIVNYDVNTGIETFYAMPETSGAEQGGVAGFNPQFDVNELLAPGGWEGSDDDSVFGNDDRVEITNPVNSIHDEYGNLKMQFSDGSYSFCSGAMVGPFHFLTAGHCVHDGDWITQSNSSVSLARDGDDRFYGSANVSNIVSVTGWTVNGDANHDWALIGLDRNLGDNVGWEGRWWWSTNGPLTGLEVSIAGYPGDLAGNTSQTSLANDVHEAFMYESTGDLLAPTSNQLRYNDTLDTAGGMSGSGVIEDRAGSRYVVGVHAYGDGGNGTNEATRMTESISDIIADRRNGGWSTPTDRADLTDWDTWFNNQPGDTQVSFMSTSNVSPGDNLSVTMYPRNIGTATTGAYDVSFYASTNTFISTADTLLGTVSMNSLGEFAWDTATLSVEIQDQIDAGTYWVGWIVDSGNTVTEFSEGANTGYITGTQLVVNQPLPVNMTSAEGQAWFVNQSTTFPALNSNDTLSFDAYLNSNGDIDSYYFAVESSGSYEIRGGDFGNAVNPVIAVYNATTGERLELDNDSGVDDDGLITMNLTAWERYIVAVGDWEGDTADDVNIQIIGSVPFNASTISIDATGYGSNAFNLLNAAGDTDFFKFTTPADVGSNGTVTVTPDAGSGLNAVMTLWDADGEFIVARNLSGVDGAESYQLTGLMPGEEYNIIVVSDDHATQGDFTVEVQLDTIVVEPNGIDFGPVGTNLWPGYEAVSNDAYSAAAGYGWTASVGLNPFNSSRGNDLTRDKVSVRTGTFVIDVDNGTYDVDVFLGVVKKTDNQRITIEGVADTFNPAAGPNVTKSYTVTVNDGQLTFEFDGLPGLNNRINIAGIGLTEAPTPRPFNGNGDGGDDPTRMGLVVRTLDQDASRFDVPMDTTAPIVPVDSDASQLAGSAGLREFNDIAFEGFETENTEADAFSLSAIAEELLAV